MSHFKGGLIIYLLHLLIENHVVGSPACLLWWFGQNQILEASFIYSQINKDHYVLGHLLKSGQ